MQQGRDGVLTVLRILSKMIIYDSAVSQNSVQGQEEEEIS